MSARVRPAACCLLALATGCTPPVSPSPAASAARSPAPLDAVIQHALETTVSGEVVSWREAEGGAHGTVTPLRTFRVGDGFCRDYAVTVSDTAGQRRTWQGRACRDGSGTWRATVVGS